MRVLFAAGNCLLAAFLSMPGCGQRNQSSAPEDSLELDYADMQGQRLKLSDYRGKVVLLSFWGHF